MTDWIITVVEVGPFNDIHVTVEMVGNLGPDGKKTSTFDWYDKDRALAHVERQIHRAQGHGYTVALKSNLEEFNRLCQQT